MNTWWDWRKAVFGQIDQGYRKAFLREDKTQFRILIAVGAVWALAHSYVEYLDLGLTPSFYLLVILRLLFISGSILLFQKLPKIHNVDRVDLATLTWGVAIVLLAYISNASRNVIHTRNVNIDLAWVLGFYLILPNRQLYKSIPALLTSLISICILINPENIRLQDITTPSFLANISGIHAMSVIGILTSLRIESHRYQQYLIQKTLIDGRAQLKELASTDSLTGILNRRSFIELAEIQFDRFKRYKENFSFAILDIDGLKTINDTYGHPAGDHSITLLIQT